MAIATQPGDKRRREIYYPTGDGKPMGETTKHRDQMFYCIAALQAYFADRPDVYISGNDFVYYEEGNPVKRVSPDCYVVFGVGRHGRDLYKCWEEGKPPDVVFEITSKKTKKEDQNTKLPLYENRLKVPEYFQFDPTGDYLKPRLQGHRLIGGHYQPLLPIDGRLYSELLGLDLVVEGDLLRLVDPMSGEKLPTAQEAFQRAKQEAQARIAEQQRADAERQRAERLEAEIARLRAEMEALRQDAVEDDDRA